MSAHLRLLAFPLLLGVWLVAATFATFLFGTTVMNMFGAALCLLGLGALLMAGAVSAAALVVLPFYVAVCMVCPALLPRLMAHEPRPHAPGEVS